LATKKASGGGKLSRSEVVTVRFDPKVRYALDLAARAQRRTVSSLIEWAVDRALHEVTTQAPNGQETKITDLLNQIWDVDESDRFLNLAITAPELLTFEEQKILKHMRGFSHLWDGNEPKRKAIRDDWEKLKVCGNLGFFASSTRQNL